MEMETVIENNKNIALFMGGRIKDDKDIWLPIHGLCCYRYGGMKRSGLRSA